MRHNASQAFCLQEVWAQLLHQAAPEQIVKACTQELIANKLFSIAAVPEGQPVKQELLLEVPLPTDSGGASAHSLATATVSEEGQDSVRMRFAAAQALGLLGSSWPSGCCSSRPLVSSV